MPYLSSVLTPPGPGRRVLVLHGDDERRLALSALLERDGCAVVAAPNRDVARALFERMAPRVVVADVETLAPDYEPLRPVLDELFGLASPSLVLLGDGRPRELPAAIVSVIEPAAQPFDDAVASAVSAALAPAAQAGL
jgi:CheY-like chemotaxis protein